MSSKSPPSSAARPVTVKEIARLSGTSASTVSRVLTGAAPVAAAKREAIVNAIAQVNFRPNLVARSLKTRSTRTIGLLINDILNPFYGALARGVEDRAGEAGYSVVFCNTNEDSSKELRYLTMLQDKSVDGVILAPTRGNHAALERLIADGVALVQVDRRLPDLDAASVTVDNERGAYEAAKHLLSAGHERIALITYEMRQISVAGREAGFLRAIGESAGPGASQVCDVSFDLSNVDSVTAQLLRGDSAPTALVAANNRIGLEVMRSIKSLGMRLAIDLALVVFDDLDIFELISPSITAVRQPAYEIGAKAADFLLEQIAGGRAAADRHEMFTPHLIVRESSASLT